MNNVLMWVAGAIALAFGALFAVPPIIDWNQYRGVFEEEVSRLLGREVRVGGKVNLRILPVPYVRFEKVQIADAPGIRGSFVRIENFTLLLSVPPLLRGVIEARQLELEGPTLRLRFDDDGGGNWQKLNIRQQDLAFVPTGFALQSAQIRDGRVIMETHAGKELARVDAINGELKAQTLYGPYRFNGAGTVAGAPLSLRIATAEADQAGGTAMTASAASTTSGAQYTFKGRLSDLRARPQLTGELTSRVPLKFGDAQADQGRSYEMRATVSADHGGADLENIVISFDNEGRPQQLSGDLKATWKADLEIVGKLQSKWLDLDALAAGRTRQAPFRVIELLSGGGFSIGAGGSSRIDLEVDQANLGSEIASRLGVRIVEADGEVRIDRVSANLPGRARLRADGLLSTGKDGVAWQGHAFVGGGSFDRFLKWAWPGAVDVSGNAAGKFELSGKLAYNSGSIEFSEASVLVAGRTSRGGGKYTWRGKPLLTLDWHGDSIDLSGLGKNVLSNENLAALVGFASSRADDVGKLRRELRDTDFDLRLQAAELTDGARVLSGVDMLVSRTANKLRFGKSRLTIEPGLSMSIEGDLENVDKDPKWQLNGIVSAGSRKALGEFIELVKLATRDKTLLREARNAYPAQLAFSSLSSDVGGTRLTSFEADGSLRSDRLRLRLESKGPARTWRTNQFRLDAKLDGYTVDALAALLGKEQGRGRNDGARQNRSSNTPPNPSGAGAPQPSFLRLNVVGVPKSRLRAAATLASSTWQLRVDGEGKPNGSDPALVWRGKGEVVVQDLNRFARHIDPAVARMIPPAARATGVLQFAEDKGSLIVEPVDFAVAGSRFTGRLTFNAAKQDGERPSLRGHLSIDRLNAPALLVGLIKPSAGSATRSGVQASGAANPLQSIWPDRPFDLTIAGLFDTDLAIKARRLRLSNNVTVANAVLALETHDGGVSMKQTGGQVFDGQLTSELSLAPASAGARFKGKITLEGAKLPALVATLPGRQVAGKFSVTLSGASQALSPRALMTALRGNGTVRLQGATVPGLEVRALSAIADGVVIGEVDPAGIKARLSQSVVGSQVNIGNTSVALKLSDGTLEVGKIQLRRKNARLMNQTVIDIVQFAIDSQWTIDTVFDKALGPDLAPKPLPPVQIVYAGALAELAALEPTVNTGDLQRELTVQKMEHDVRRLERLRREDEERARVEAERLKRLELERRREQPPSSGPL